MILTDGQKKAANWLLRHSEGRPEGQIRSQSFPFWRVLVWNVKSIIEHLGPQENVMGISPVGAQLSRQRGLA